MVWTVTARGEATGYGSNPLIGDTFTPTEGNIIVAAATGWDTQITGCTGWANTTFTERAAITSGGYELVGLAALVGASPGSDQLQLTTTGGDLRYAVSVVEISGLDDTGDITDIFLQLVSEASYNGGSANAIGAGLSAFASSTNATLVLLGSAYESQTFTQQSGFTSYETSSTGSGGYAEIALNPAEEAAPTYSPITGSTNDMAIAFELAEASAGSSIIPLAMHHRNQMK